MTALQEKELVDSAKELARQFEVNHRDPEDDRPN